MPDEPKDTGNIQPKEQPVKPESNIKPEPKKDDLFTGQRGNWKVVGVELADDTGKVRVENLETYDIMFILYENGKWSYSLLNKDDKKVTVSSPNFEKLLNAVIKIWDEDGKIVDKANENTLRKIIRKEIQSAISEQLVHGSQAKYGGDIKLRHVYARLTGKSDARTAYQLSTVKNYGPSLGKDWDTMNGFAFAELLAKDKKVKVKGNIAYFSDGSEVKLDNYIVTYYNVVKDFLAGKLKKVIADKLPGWNVIVEARYEQPKKGKKTPDNVDILIPGFGVVRHDLAKKEVIKKIEDLLKRAKQGNFSTIGKGNFETLASWWDTLSKHSGEK